MNHHVSRRHFLQAAGGAALASLAPAGAWALATPRRPKVAAIMTVFTYRSHAHVILENFLEPYLFNGKKTDPGVDVVSFYVDQTPGGDMSRGVAKQYGIPIYKTIDKAMCLGGKDLAVDAALIIGEHGSYPTNALGQVEYPRKRFFDNAVAPMLRANRFVPIYNDKHLSYRWDWAKEMYDVCQAHHIPFMAASSVPLAQRIPPLELPVGAQIEHAVSIHGGGVESYDFHGLEVLESMIEFRRGGETGVSRVEFLKADALLAAGQAGRWSIPMAKAAMAVEADGPQQLPDNLRLNGQEPHGILVTYKDGLTAVCISFPGSGTRWNFACKLKGDPSTKVTSFYVGPWQNRNLFRALSHAIQHHFIDRRSPYPVERTLLTTGIVEASMRSRAKGEPVVTPNLQFAYKARNFDAYREMGATWKIITDKTPQPKGVARVGIPD